MNFVSADHLLSAIVDSSDDAIVSKDLEGKVTSWNRAAERIFGFTAAEMIGQPITLIIPPERLAEEPKILDTIKKGGKVDHFDTRRIRKNGVYIDVSVTISPIKNAEGTIVGASKIVRDVTAKKHSDAELQSQKAKLEILNRVGRALSGELDLEKLVQAVTDAGKELCGAAFGAFFYNVENEAGGSYMLYCLSGAPKEAFEKFGMPRNTPIFAPTFSGEGVLRLDDVLADPRYGQMSPHHGMPAGHLPVRSYLAVPVISKLGGVIGGLFFGHPEIGRFTEDSEVMMVAVAAQAAIAIDNARLYSTLERDLQQQKMMEKALRESEALSSSVLNSTADCITVLDLQGHLLSMNPPGLALFDIEDFEKIRSKSWVKLWPETVQNDAIREMETAMRGRTGRFQGPCITAKGVSKWWDVLITPLRDGEGNVAKLTATARDITEQRKASEELRAAEAEAVRQSRIKDEFLATLSHELRTPLQSILGWTQILITGDSDPDELKQGLEIIDRNAQAQTRIIEDLLDMSRILSGKVRLDVQRVALASVIEAALETVKPSAQAKNIRMHAVIDPLAQPVSGDPSRLQQIFWNLLSNAIKFTPSNGRIQILLERVNSHLEVSVIDSGSGIAPDFLPHVFERFRQADASTTRGQGGLGLGLAIVKHLTELHGGSVRVKSGGPAQGATFTVMLPLAALHDEPQSIGRRHPSQPQVTSTSRSLPRLDGVSVLVVDDEEDARNLVGLMLRKAGAAATTAGSAKQALELLRMSVPDLVISDIGMPVEDGYSLIRKIRELPSGEGGSVPAIALSAYTRTEDRIKAISAGFQMHLSKPADGVELLTMAKSLTRAL